jgi:hypothetical protein
MNISEADLELELEAFGAHRIQVISELAHQGADIGLGPALLLALGSRETNLQNIVGDVGHGRGWLQIDDRFHGPWLDRQAGCASGSWKATFKSALPEGRVPTLSAATIHAIELLRQNFTFARGRGVAKPDLLRFACAAYNAGAGGALSGFHANNVDANTTGADYSADVMSRRQAIRAWLKAHPLPA